ncbi:ABC transporter permease subunit [Thermococcus sp. M36]|uniref:ABC transporter permease subunit n=1 Tax=Thermococcus sp. M36 TaxID=1638261 RepID=UPI00143B1BA8|nr:ABC transporter permease subunit [Thermococcus sp. M36]NJE05606.1 ABC transporter permease subunit [Thermococcus sp. M36]
MGRGTLSLTRILLRYVIVTLLVAFVLGYAIKGVTEKRAYLEAIGFFQYNPNAQKVVEAAEKLGMDPFEYYVKYIAPKNHPELRKSTLRVGLEYMGAVLRDITRFSGKYSYWNYLYGTVQPTWGYIYRTLLFLVLADASVVLLALFLAFRAVRSERFYGFLQVTARVFNGIPVWFFVVLFFLLIIYSPLPSDLANGIKGSGWSMMAYFIFPVLSVLLVASWGLAEGITVIMREEFQQPYVEAKKAMGLPERRVKQHVVRASIVPVMHVWLQNFIEIQTLVLVVDYLFRLNGLGTLLASALIITPDSVFFYAMTFAFVVTVLVLLNFIVSMAVEVLSIKLEPRGSS